MKKLFMAIYFLICYSTAVYSVLICASIIWDIANINLYKITELYVMSIFGGFLFSRAFASCIPSCVTHVEDTRDEKLEKIFLFMLSLIPVVNTFSLFMFFRRIIGDMIFQPMARFNYLSYFISQEAFSFTVCVTSKFDFWLKYYGKDDIRYLIDDKGVALYLGKNTGFCMKGRNAEIDLIDYQFKQRFGWLDAKLIRSVLHEYITDKLEAA